MSKKKQQQNKNLLRVVTLIMGLGFAGSTLAIALSSVFSQSNYPTSQSQSSADSPSIEEQIQMQVQGYEKVLAREPQNLTALQGLAQIHLQTRNPEKAIPVLEKLVEYYPQQPEFASILEILQQQQGEASTPPESSNFPAAE